ncbi:hypothetical protein [Leptospira levettii]|uniref:Uncharacterized protein n=1 Tax=Leptospira levettii TaxID=2023178 RepID=A0AAW5V6G4_9LEPT|nr:hypothetical protein [Leptospira levettii]MCW7467874.1 hypothetical protein [Leptospira levettii]MCW7513482.1 hypothetical protein [Leptospira levettii]MCW7517226.1 hypothetical protein [Leptospira levettii]
MKNNSIIQRKDLIYIIFILISINIYFGTQDFYYHPKIYDIVSFASSVISIILSLLAIIYTFFQNFYSNSANEDIKISTSALQTSVTTIEDTLKKIDHATNMLDSTIEKKFTSIKDDIGTITQNSIASYLKDINKQDSNSTKKETHFFSDNYKNLVEYLKNDKKYFDTHAILKSLEDHSITGQNIDLYNLIIESMNPKKKTQIRINYASGYFFFIISMLEECKIYEITVDEDKVFVKKLKNDISSIL